MDYELQSGWRVKDRLCVCESESFAQPVYVIAILSLSINMYINVYLCMYLKLKAEAVFYWSVCKYLVCDWRKRQRFYSYVVIKVNLNSMRCSDETGHLRGDMVSGILSIIGKKLRLLISSKSSLMLLIFCCFFLFYFFNRNFFCKKKCLCHDG